MYLDNYDAGGLMELCTDGMLNLNIPTRSVDVPHDFPIGEAFAAALVWAYELHRGQYRKVALGEEASLPYISHLLGVASIALEYGATETEAIAALLHDALEDGPEYTGQDAVSLEQAIRDRFGPEVAQLVKAATDAMPNAGEVKAPWAERKAQYLRELMRKEDTSALLVSASDKLHNARAILNDVLAAGESAKAREQFFSRFSQSQGATLQYYRLLVDAHRAAPAGQIRGRLGELVDELDRTVCRLEETCQTTAEQVRALPFLNLGRLTPG